MIDEWGENIGSEDDEGVFSESALGGTGPDVNTGKFPYAPSPTKTIKRVAANRYAVMEDAPPVQAAFPGQPMGGVAVRQATAGMGGVIGWETGEDPLAALGTGTRKTAPPSDYTAPGGSGSQDTGWSDQQWGNLWGGLSRGISTITDAVGAGFSIARAEESHDLEMQQAQMQLDQQMQMFSARLAQESDPELMRLMNEARTAGQSGNLQQMLSAIQAMQAASSSWTPWIVGGVAVVAIGGLIYWLTTRD